ncbi:MAG: hypothetical protein P4L64_11140, partial [Caulobacteraceae bacterium]|nr:hypothetical protein [Caulobacteraceae bacterium]
MTPLVRAFLAPLCGLVLAGQAAAQGPDLAARGLAAVALVNNAPTNSIPYATGVNPAAVPIFRKAIANTRAGVSDTIILFEGDSTTAGFLGAAPTSSVGGRAASAPSILATIGVAGLPTQSQSIWADANTGSGWSAYDPRLVFGSGWAANSGLDVLGGHPAGNSTTTAGNLAFTPTIPVD